MPLSAAALRKASWNLCGNSCTPLDEGETRLVVVIGPRLAIEELSFGHAILKLHRIAAALCRRLDEGHGAFGIAVVIRADLGDQQARRTASGPAIADREFSR